LPSEVSISHHGFQGAPGFSSTEENETLSQACGTRERDAFWGLALCCRTSGFCETPACPKEADISLRVAPTAGLSPAAALQTLW